MLAAQGGVTDPLIKMTATQSELQTKEANLVKRVCDGDREAFYELVRPYERLIYATAISVVKNAADAEEAAQEAVLKAFSNLSGVRGESKFSTWLVRITYNEGKMATIEISCVEVWREISNYLDEEISLEMRERMEAHFKACAHCTAVLDGTRNVVGLVGDGRVFQMPDGFSKRLYKKLQKLP